MEKAGRAVVGHGAGNDASKSPASPVPAVWAAFARASAWKSWMLVVQSLLLLLLIFVNLKVAKTNPDVVVVRESDGQSTYVPQAEAGPALVGFLEEQKSRPSDVSVLCFSRLFLQRMFQINSSTVDEAFEEACTMMDERVAAATRDEYRRDKVLETYRLARMKSRITVDDLVLLEKTPSLLHLKAEVTRKKSALLDDTANVSTDRLAVELVERIVPRSKRRPYALEIAELSVKRIPMGTGASPDAVAQAPQPDKAPQTDTTAQSKEGPHAP